MHFNHEFTTRVVKKVALGKAMVECLITFSQYDACMSKHFQHRQQIGKNNFGFFCDDKVECNLDNDYKTIDLDLVFKLRCNIQRAKKTEKTYLPKTSKC